MSASSPSSHTLQTLFNSESMPMSNGQQPLAGDTDFISSSDEDIPKLVAALRDEESPEVRARLYQLLNRLLHTNGAYEYTLAGPADAQVDVESNNDELPVPQQGLSTDVEHVENAQASFPTLENFTAPVADLPKWPQIAGNLYHPPQPSVDAQAPTQDDAWPQLGYHPALFYLGQPPQAFAGPSYPHRQPQVMGQFYPHHTVAGPLITNNPTGAFHQALNAPLQMGAGGGSTVQPDSRASAKHGKRKAHQMVGDGNSTSSIAQKPKKKKPRWGNDIGSGKFGPYTLLDASATVMPMPVHDPQPFDISFRRTLDPDGKPLQTRRFGVIELDDSYPRGSDNVAEYHSSGPICVRLCDWDDQPCGLYIEMERTRIEDHLWYWHGVTMEDETVCRFKDCTELKPMQCLGRHIQTVHFKTASRCSYCSLLCARSDSLFRHHKVCQILSDSRERAMQAGHDFYPKEGIKSVYGYIVPAT